MKQNKSFNVMILAGEHSGDQRAAELVKRLIKLNVNMNIFGMGGDEMRLAGVNVEFNCSELGVIGFFEIFKLLPRLYAAFSYVKRTLIGRRPDLLVCIDYQAFNIRAAKVAYKIGVPVFFYVGPQIWASRPKRIKRYVRYVDYLAVLFPFEVGLYDACSQIDVKYVGHPLLESMTKVLSKDLARDLLSIPHSRTVVAFLPGSRAGEVLRLLPIFCEVMHKLQQCYPDLDCIVVRAETISMDVLQSILDRYGLSRVKVVENTRCQALSAADYVVTASGTVTLEAALLEKPMVVVYKLNKFTCFLMRKFKVLKIPFISLVNIVCRREIVKEYVQENCSVENILHELFKIFKNKDYRERMQDDLREVFQVLSASGEQVGLSHWVSSVCEELK
jgi:lipid-A-disaccharide synthase